MLCPRQEHNLLLYQVVAFCPRQKPSPTEASGKPKDQCVSTCWWSDVGISSTMVQLRAVQSCTRIKFGLQNSPVAGTGSEPLSSSQKDFILNSWGIPQRLKDGISPLRRMCSDNSGNLLFNPCLLTVSLEPSHPTPPGSRDTAGVPCMHRSSLTLWDLPSKTCFTARYCAQLIAGGI